MRKISGKSSALGRRKQDPHGVSKSAGFTLIELMVVIVLILLIALISFPFVMGQIRRAQVQGAADQTVSLIQKTRLQAIRDNRDLDITAAGDQISGAGLVALQELNIELWTDSLCYDPDGDGTDDYQAGTMSFDPQGKASAKTAFCVHDSRGNIFQIAVDSLQGTPRVRKYLQAGDSPTGSAGFFLDSWTWY